MKAYVGDAYPSVRRDNKVLRSEFNGSLKTFRSRARTWVRFLLLLITLLALTSNCANTLVYTFVLTCTRAETSAASNATVLLPFTDFQTTALTSALAVGAILAVFIIPLLITRFGARLVFSTCGVISIISTTLMPLGLQTNFYLSFILRIFQGIAFAVNYPMIGAFSSEWMYYKQYGFCSAFLIAYTYLSPLIAYPISGKLCSSIGWQSIFYGHSIVAAILFSVFLLLYRNSPENHPLITPKEITKISKNKCGQKLNNTTQIPYKQILTTPAVWAIWLGNIGSNIFVTTIYLYSPSYFSSALKMDMTQTGLVSAGPPAFQLIFKILCGFLSDKFRWTNETNRLRIFNSVAYFGSAITLLILIVVQSHAPAWLCFTLLTTAMTFLGFAAGGVIKAPPLLAQQFCSFILGVVALGIFFTILIVPYLHIALAPHDTKEQWSHIFWLMIGLLIISNIIFCAFCSGEPAEWTKMAVSNDREAKYKDEICED